MSKEATDRYNVKVEIPITVILETIFSTDNNDVETLCRYARKYGYVDFDEKDKVYKLQKDYNKQDFYVWLSNEERKQYDYENYLIDENERLKDLYKKTCQHLFNIGNDELARYFEAQIDECNVFIPQELGGKDNENN